MKQKFTLTQKKKKMNNSHQGISELLGAVILIGIAIGGVVIIQSGLMGISFENLECEIQELQVYEISTNNYWGTVRILNSGDYIIDDYKLILYNDGTITPLNHIKNQINTNQFVNIEFDINGTLNNKIIIGVEIKNQQQSSICKKVIEI